MRKSKIDMTDINACTIIIDTNQFFSDWTLDSSRWLNLREYISTTNASLIFPEIIWREIGENYIGEAIKKQKVAHSAVQNYMAHRNFFCDINPDVKHFPPKIDCSGLLGNDNWNDVQSAYLAWLKRKLDIHVRNFVPIKTSWFETITERAIKHQKPFNVESDKGFKDSILWMSILELAKRPGYKDSPIVLISANSKDFAESSNFNQLHSSLVAEASSKGLDVKYFRSLDSFLDDWPSKTLSTYKIIPKAVNANFIQNQLFDLLRVQVIRRTGFNIEPSQMGISNFNYFIRNEKDVNILDISTSGFVDLGKASMRLIDFSGNLIFELDGKSVPVTKILAEVNLINNNTLPTVADLNV